MEKKANWRAGELENWRTGELENWRAGELAVERAGDGEIMETERKGDYSTGQTRAQRKSRFIGRARSKKAMGRLGEKATWRKKRTGELANWRTGELASWRTGELVNWLSRPEIG